jgi:hypothetical protein
VRLLRETAQWVFESAYAVVMQMRDPLLLEFSALKEAEISRQMRGVRLERIVARRFRAAHYRVRTNPRSARPRQTDLMALAGEEVFVIEVKWTAKAVGVDAVASLRDRLARTAGRAIGVLISVSGFTTSLVDEVRTGRAQPVLLIDGDELEGVLSRHADLRRLLRAKRDALVLDGDVLVSINNESRSAVGRDLLGSELIEADSYFVLPDGTCASHIAGPGGFGQYTFARELVDPDWVAELGTGVSVNLALELDDVTDAIAALCELCELGWATEAGQWCIQQSETNWHGVGAAGLVRAIEAWAPRYEAAGIIHHTEQVIYQDVTPEGFFTLGLDIAADSRRRVRHGEISMRLIGVPLDRGPVDELCRTLDIRALTHFRPLETRAINTLSLRESPPVRPRAYLVQYEADDDPDPDEREWVRGIVVDNPFRDCDHDSQLRAADLHPLCDTGLLVCDLRSWHPLARSKDLYRLELVEYAWTSVGLFFALEPTGRATAKARATARLMSPTRAAEQFVTAPLPRPTTVSSSSTPTTV